jgi:tetratricopeptide (TPR) repeat protein
MLFYGRIDCSADFMFLTGKLKITMRKIHYIVLFLGVCMFAACATQQNAMSESKTRKEQEQIDPQAANKLTAVFIEASKEKILGNFSKAMDLYQKCVELDPSHAPSLYEMARIYRMQGSNNDALMMAEKAVEIDSDNKWYNLMLASLYEQTGQISNAIKVFESLQLLYPENTGFMYEIAMLYLKENRFDDALAIYDKMERISGADEDIIIQKHKLYLMNEQPDKAVKEIEKLIKLYPGESRYYALLAELYLGQENYTKAIESLEKIRELDPQNPYIHITLAEYYFKTGKRNEALQELKKGFANPELEVEIKFQVLFTYYSDDEMHGDYKDHVAELSEILISTHPGDARPYSLKADLLIQDENYEEARKTFRKVLEIDNSKYFMWETLLRLNAILQDNEAMRDESLQAISLFPLQPLPYLFAGLAYYQLENYQDAIQMFNSGKDLVADDDELLTDFLMHLGDIYSKIKQHEASDAAYEEALALDAENAYVLNNYSYFLSLRKERLEYAKTMSRKSNELSPDNKHYQDTYGWIMYQMGNYEEAKIWIKKSMENNASEDAVVLEHYGDVLYKLGNTEEALIYWEKALELGGEVTEHLEQKVKEGILYE